jgi:hypothetical protein
LIGKKVIATQKLNAYHGKEKLKNFFLAHMCNGVCLIFVWLLLSYQSVYVTAHIICNQPVHLDTQLILSGDNVVQKKSQICEAAEGFVW